MSGLPRAEARRYLLGDIDDATVLALAATFANADLDIPRSPGRHSTLVSVGLRHQPFSLPRGAPGDQGNRCRVSTAELADPLRSMGQLPGNPPNVGGHPALATWLASSATAARFSAAINVARATPDEAPALAAAQAGDWSGLPTCSCVRLASRTRPSPPSRISNRPCPPDPVRGACTALRFA